MQHSKLPAELLARLASEHRASPAASEKEIAALEERIGARVEGELRTLLLHCNGVDLWPEGDYPCRLLSTTEIEWVANVAYETGPEGLLALLRVEADYLAIQTDRSSAYFGTVVDCFHETFPFEMFGVAASIADLLRLALNSDDKEWIWPAARAFGVDFAEEKPATP